MNVLRLLIKLPLLLLYCLFGVLLALLVVPWLSRTRLLQLAGWWHRNLLRILRVTVHIRGDKTVHQGLMVSNHISWLDIIALGSVFHTYFVSKAEVAGWPIIGTLAKASGTLFLPRGGNQSSAISQAMAERIREDSFVLFFPEGTTHWGTEVHNFHPRLFGAAIDGGVPVVPVALYYHHEPQPHPKVPYIGDQSFGANLWWLLQCPPIEVTVRMGHAISSVEKQRKQLAVEAQQQVATLLQTTIADHS